MSQPAPSLTPALQQAFRLLQMPAPALQSCLQRALEQNALLQADEAFDATWTLDAPVELELAGEPDESATTLHEHLARQLAVAPLPNGPRAIGRALIGAIDDDGYLRESPQGIAAAVAGRVRAESAVVESVLGIIQQFDPAGVGARSVPECIELQLAQLAPGTPGLGTARRIARNHLQLADNLQFVDLQRLTGAAGTDVEAALALIRGCERQPGAVFRTQPGVFVAPDAFARPAAAGWTVEPNPVATPRLRVNERYAAMLTRSADHAALRVQLHEARWLTEGLALRNEAVLRVARAIVDRQRAFLDRSADRLPPVPARELVEAVGMPESAVARATVGKYLHTPRGVFEFRFFLSNELPVASGVAA